MEDNTQQIEDNQEHTQPLTAKKNPRPVKAKKAVKRRKKPAKKLLGTSANGKRGRAGAPFPVVPFESALVIAEAIQKHAGGQKKVRRLTIFDKLGKSPDSGTSRAMVTNSSRYGMTKGSYIAEFLELTELGDIATSPESPIVKKLKARFTLGIQDIPAFKHLYESNSGRRLPSPEIMRDSLADVKIGEAHRKECVEVFLANAKYLGLLRTISGAERLIPIEQVIEETSGEQEFEEPSASKEGWVDKQLESNSKKDWKKVCFFIAPIGKEGSEERQHSDMVLEAFVTRALEGEGFEVVRADKIADPGMISSQIIEYLIKSGLVIADLSFHNPNVFYELAFRHAIGKPTVHLIRNEDQIPFDVKDFRTIVIDTKNKYDLVAKLDVYRAEIASKVRLAISGAENDSNPIRTFVPGLEIHTGKDR